MDATGFLRLLVAAASLAACSAHFLKRDAASLQAEAEATKEFSQQEMAQCMAGKRVVLIGDSTIRYEYLTLAYFAEYGEWPEANAVKYGGTKQWQGPPLWEGDIPDAIQASLQTNANCVGSDKTWSAFYEYTNAIFNGRETCDCYRKDWQWTGAPAANMTENRIYNNPVTATSISYFQWHGAERPPHGTCTVGSMAQCPSGQFNGKFSWTLPTPEFLSYIVKLVNPTHVIVDSGWWPMGADTATQTQFYRLLAQAGAKVMSPATKLYWRTTPRGTHSAKIPPSDSAELDNFQAFGWQLYDARNYMSQLQGTNPDASMFIDGDTHILPNWYAALGQYAVQSLFCGSANLTSVVQYR